MRPPFYIALLVFLAGLVAACVQPQELERLGERLDQVEAQLGSHRPNPTAEPKDASTPDERVDAHIRCVRELCGPLEGAEYSACVTACAEAAKGLKGEQEPLEGQR